MKKLWIGLVLVIVVVGFLGYRGMTGNITGSVVNEEMSGFAQCLTDAGATMYGTDWCKYCQIQKERVGKSFEYVDYVNCDFNVKECNSAGVQGYPMWVVNGEVYSGVQPLEYLASLSGCEL